MNKAANYPSRNSMPPRAYFFATKRWRIGLIHAVESSFLIVAGAFLLLEINKVPNLKVQMLIMGIGMLLGGIVLARIAFIDFLGFLRIDADGVHLRSRAQCESFAWDQITSWNISNVNNVYDFAPFIEFFVAGDSKSPRTIDGKYLRAEQFNDIRDRLTLYQSWSGLTI